MSIRHSISLVISLCCALIMSCAYAADDSLKGAWDGAIFVGDNPQGIDMTITAMNVNEKGGEFHYGEPRACRVQLAYITERDRQYWFALTEPTGGYCDRLDGGRIKLKPNSDYSALEFEVSVNNGGVSEAGTLNKRK